MPGHQEFFVASTAIGTRKLRRRFYEQVTAEVTKAVSVTACRTVHWAALSDPCRSRIIVVGRSSENGNAATIGLTF